MLCDSEMYLKVKVKKYCVRVRRGTADKRLVIRIKNEVTRSTGMETNLGKSLQFLMGINLLEPISHMIKDAVHIGLTAI